MARAKNNGVQEQEPKAPAEVNPAEHMKQAAEPASGKTESGVPVTNTAQSVEKAVPETPEQTGLEPRKEQVVSSGTTPEAVPPVEQAAHDPEQGGNVKANESAHTPDGVQADQEPEKQRLPASDYPEPPSLKSKEDLVWNEDNDAVENYVKLGQKLAAGGDLYRNTAYAGGLLLASSSTNVPPKPIMDGRALAAPIVDRVRIST